jgi:hypothetical protein
MKTNKTYMLTLHTADCAEEDRYLGLLSWG